MKKKYLAILVAPIVTASAILFPASILSQDLSEAQRKERCQNNRNRVAELETQLKVVDAQFASTMTHREMEDARDHMVFVRAFNGDTTKYGQERIDKLYRIAAIYHSNFSNCVDTLWKYDHFALDFNSLNIDNCVRQLANIIAGKIDKAKALNRSEIIAKKSDIDKQLAFHRNSLIALGCDQIVAAETFDPKSVAGTWNWSFAPAGQTLEKHGSVTFQKTEENKGTMSWSGGSLGHWIQSGQTVTITWENNPSEDIMTLSADGHNLSGKNNKGWPVEGTRGMQ